MQLFSDHLHVISHGNFINFICRESQLYVQTICSGIFISPWET